MHFKIMESMMVKLLFSIIIGFFTLPVTADRVEFDIEREWQENYSVDSSLLPGKKLVVDITSGAIEVTGHPGSEISAQVNIHWWGKQESDLEQAAKELQLVVEQTANGYLIFLETPFRDRSYEYFTRSRGYEFRYDITLQVPRNLDLELHTIRQGDVQINGLSGHVEVENVTGDVLLDNVLASGLVKTVRGDILLGFRQTPDLDLSLYSRFGDMLSAFEYRILPESSSLTVVRDGSLTRYSKDHFSNIRIARGGLAMKLESISGDIIIQEISI